VIGEPNSYGTPMNANGGGVYAMEWTSDYINVYFFPRDAIPDDITNENPDPSGWGTPTANFESQYGDCDIDAHFPAQTIVSLLTLLIRLSFSAPILIEYYSTSIPISVVAKLVATPGLGGQTARRRLVLRPARST
jgi:hypothetical protein